MKKTSHRAADSQLHYQFYKNYTQVFVDEFNKGFFLYLKLTFDLVKWQ